ncbi:MAG: 4Fe-4S dicluster domain-containing protein [Pseudomonadota bacterium]
MSNSLADQILAAGVVGAGGAGFPTHVKATSRVDTVVVNGAECEPLIYSDQVVMRLFARETLAGLKQMMDAVGATRGIYALKAEYADVLEVLTPEAARYPDVEIQLLQSVYPSGDEQILAYECTGRIVPEGGIPLDVGVVVDNVETLLNVHRATLGRPVTHRTVTVNGEVRHPAVFRLPVGTSYRDAVAAAGGTDLPDENIAVIDGGPMMGMIRFGLDHPMRKTTGALIIVPKDHEFIVRRTMPRATETRITVAACCQCRECTDLCPRWLLGHDLEPHKVMRAIVTRSQVPSQITQAHICCLCGVCEIVACPLGLSPRNVFAMVREQLREQKVPNPHHRKPERVRDSYEYTKIPKMRALARTGLLGYYAHLHEAEPAVPVRRVRLLTGQHIGAPAVPVVVVGDRVNEGDLVAAAREGALSANLHASISGTVSVVGPDVIEIQG